MNIMDWVTGIKGALKVKGPAEDFIKMAKTDPDGDGPLPANWKSTEFWGGQAVPQIALVWAGLNGLVPPKVFVIGSVSLAGVYILSRTAVKIMREIAPVIIAVKALKAGDLDKAADAVKDAA